MVDKRGRPETFASTENYKKYYELTSSEEEDSLDDEDEKILKKSKEVCTYIY